PMSLLAELGNGLSGRLVLRFTLTQGRRRRQPCRRHHPPAGRRGDPTHDERQMSSTENTRAGASRARLVEAAVTAFAERGFHGTSTRDIAAAAGMSPAAVYVHHRSKEDLLYLISRVGHDDTVAVIRQAADSTDDPAARLAAVMRAFALHHAREHTRARIVNYELNALSREHLAEISAIRRQIRLDVQAMIQDGVDA